MSDTRIRVTVNGPNYHKSRTFSPSTTIGESLIAVSNGWLPSKLLGTPAVIMTPPVLAAYLARELRNRGVSAIAVRDWNGLLPIVHSANPDYPDSPNPKYPLWHLLRQRRSRLVVSERPLFTAQPTGIYDHNNCFRIADPNPAVAAYWACKIVYDDLRWMAVRDTWLDSPTRYGDFIIASKDPKRPCGALAPKLSLESLGTWLMSREFT